jgi:trk/ktr system potassium uptake protein
VPKNRLFEENVLVVGLGRFGAAAALELQRLGHHVVAIEQDAVLAETFLGKFTKIVQGDASQPGAIAAIRARDYKLAIVGIGSSVEASVLASLNLVDAGIPSIWAKALSPEHGRILTRIGVQHVIFPEAETGRRVAHLLNGKLMDYIEFDDGFAIAKVRAPGEAVGRTLADVGLRSKWGVTVVGVKLHGQDFTYARPETVVPQGCILIVAGDTTKVEQFAAGT